MFQRRSMTVRQLLRRWVLTARVSHCGWLWLIGGYNTAAGHVLAKLQSVINASDHSLYRLFTVVDKWLLLWIVCHCIFCFRVEWFLVCFVVLVFDFGVCSTIYVRAARNGVVNVWRSVRPTWRQLQVSKSRPFSESCNMVDWFSGRSGVEQR